MATDNAKMNKAGTMQGTKLHEKDISLCLFPFASKLLLQWRLALYFPISDAN